MHNNKNGINDVLVADIQSSMITFKGYATFIFDILHLHIISIITNRINWELASSVLNIEYPTELDQNNNNNYSERYEFPFLLCIWMHQNQLLNRTNREQKHLKIMSDVQSLELIERAIGFEINIHLPMIIAFSIMHSALSTLYWIYYNQSFWSNARWISSWLCLMDWNCPWLMKYSSRNQLKLISNGKNHFSDGRP